jgi:hypothetical protein
MYMRLCGVVTVFVTLMATMPALAASPPLPRPAQGIRALDAMMVAMAGESALSGATIRALYYSHLDLLMLDEYSELAGALDNGGLVPLPDDPKRFNLAPRLDGLHPIGEKDLGNQTSYVAARPAMIGALIDIASRVKSGPLEITSLVRHGDYQEALRTTNANATTAVPMHTMGLAIDIALINSKLETVYEIRDVLRRMQADGDILFVGERQQLVFHVVPHPERLGHYTDFYLHAVGAPPTGRFAHVIAFPGGKEAARGNVAPTVTTEVLAMFPAEGELTAWWTNADTPREAPVPVPAPIVPAESLAGKLAASLERWFVLLLGLTLTVWRIASPRPAIARLFTEPHPAQDRSWTGR